LARLRITFEADEGWPAAQTEEREDLLGSARFWTQQMGATLQEYYPRPEAAGRVELAIRLPPAGEAVVLVVDDQAVTQQMYRRYLSRTPFRVVGLTDPRQVLETARRLLPAVICLDVMMPIVDGWEVLQALKADPQTQPIPVVVCSAWEEPELARSLGASGFLKKPIVQRDLLAVLETLNL
jgi:CheY-like chemotaxis protein